MAIRFLKLALTLMFPWAIPLLRLAPALHAVRRHLAGLLPGRPS